MAKIKKISDDAFVNDVRHIIEVGLKSAYQSVSSTMVHTYWQIGQRIVEEEQHGEKRAEYGTRLLEFLAEELSQEYRFAVLLSITSSTKEGCGRE